MREHFEKFIEMEVVVCLVAAAIVALLLMVGHAIWKPLKKTILSLFLLVIILAGAGCQTAQPDASRPSPNHLLIIGGNVLVIPDQVD